MSLMNKQPYTDIIISISAAFGSGVFAHLNLVYIDNLLLQYLSAILSCLCFGLSVAYIWTFLNYMHDRFNENRHITFHAMHLVISTFIIIAFIGSIITMVDYPILKSSVLIVDFNLTLIGHGVLYFLLTLASFITKLHKVIVNKYFM